MQRSAKLFDTSLFRPNRHLRSQCKFAFKDSIRCCFRSIRCSVGISAGSVAALPTASPHPREVNAIEQECELLLGELDRDRIGARPIVVSALQTLAQDRQSRAIQDDRLHASGPLSAKEKEVATDWVRADAGGQTEAPNISVRVIADSPVFDKLAPPPGGVDLMAPTAVHGGTAAAMRAQRALAFVAAFAAHPIGF